MQRKRFALALIVLTLIIYAVLALVYQDFVRENIVVPVASLVWMAALVIRSIPQAMLLTILILASFAIAVMGLQEIWEDAPRLKMPAAPRSGQSRYRFWLRRYRHMHRSAYYLDDVSSEMRRLILRVLSSQEHRAASEIEDLVIEFQSIVIAFMPFHP